MEKEPPLRRPNKTGDRGNGDIFTLERPDPTVYIGNIALIDPEQTTADATNRLSEGSLWDSTSVAFEATINSVFGDNHTGDLFAAFDWETERYGPLQLAVDRPDPAHAIEDADKGTLVGTLFYTSLSETGTSVLAYSMYRGPNGESIERQTAEFDQDFDIGQLAGEFTGQDQHEGAAHYFESPTGFSAITNYEALAAAGLFESAAFEASGGEYGRGDAAGYEGGGEASGIGGDGHE